MNQLLAGVALAALVGFSGFFGAIGVYKAGERAAETRGQLAASQAIIIRNAANTSSIITSIKNRDSHETAWQDQIRVESDRAHTYAVGLSTALHNAARGVPSVAGNPGILVLPDPAAVLDDTTKCTENTIRLEQAAGWWEDEVGNWAKVKIGKKVN